MSSALEISVRQCPRHSKAARSLEGWSDFAVEFQDKKLTVIAFMGTISRPGQSAHVSGGAFICSRSPFTIFCPSCSNNLLIVSRASNHITALLLQFSFPANN